MSDTRLSPRVYSYDGIVPVIDPSAYVHPEAILIGDVIIGPECYIGPGAVLRGDIGRIVVEKGANIQDACVVHTFPDREVVVEELGHIGHGAVLHGCRVCRNAMVGMNAVVMDDAVVGENSIVGAMAFVKAETQIPANSLVLGSPAKVVRKLGEKEIAWKREGSEIYMVLAAEAAEKMKPATALDSPEPDRRRIAPPKYDPKYMFDPGF